MLGRILFGTVLLLCAFVAGAEAARHNLFPWPQIVALKQRLVGANVLVPSRYVFDDSGLLISDETKTTVACPKQTARTAVLLILGQSNAANHGGQRFRSGYGPHVVNFFRGKCYIAASPLLGSTDGHGEYWTNLGNLLMASGKYDDVVLAPLAYSGSDISRWAKGGDINRVLVDTADALAQAAYRATVVLWVQGEEDYVAGTSTADYKQRFMSMLDTLRQQRVEAPVFVAIATTCLEPSNGGFKVDARDNPISRAQLALAAVGGGLQQGVNMDELVGGDDRYDDCHLGGSGERKVSQAWAELLLAVGY